MTLKEIFLMRQNSQMSNNFSLTVFCFFGPNNCCPSRFFLRTALPERFLQFDASKKYLLALFFNGRDPFLPAKNRLTFLETTNPANIFKNFTSFQRIFSKDFMRKILLILYRSCPLTSQIRVRTVSSSDDFLWGLFEIAACGFLSK